MRLKDPNGRLTAQQLGQQATERRLRWQSMRSLIGLLAFWLAVMGGLYWAMDHFLEPKQSVVTAEGALLIPRQADGHFRVPGTLNGQPVMFLVDTGASLISVTEALAQRAGLKGGEPATFHTANGPREGRITRAQSVVLQGGLGVSNLRVGTGLIGMGDEHHALLGQNFLRHFDVEISQSQLVLRPRPN